ncbi:MAG: DUF805 domain-containing protein [Pseudomonadota bacterium]
MDFEFLYLDLEGRISRKTWWLGAIGIVVLNFLVSTVVSMIAAIMGVASTAVGIGLTSLIVLALLFRPLQALTLKRLHDRDRPEQLFWYFIGPSILSALIVMLGIGGGIDEISILGTSVPVYRPNFAGALVNVASTAMFFWMLWELGIKRGDAGPNTHGPDPLGAV